MQVVAILGKKGSGKSTAAQYLFNSYPQVRVRSFASPLKRLSCTLFPLDKKIVFDGTDEEKENTFYKGKSYRKILQDVGMAMREVDPDVWLRPMETELRSLSRAVPDCIVVVDDCRFHNEATLLDGYGATYWRIRRDGLPVTATSNHPSETSLDMWPATNLYNNESKLDYLLAVDKEFRKLLEAR